MRRYRKNGERPRRAAAAALAVVIVLGTALVTAGEAATNSDLVAAPVGVVVLAPDGVSPLETVDFAGDIVPALLGLEREAALPVASWPVAPGVRRRLLFTRRDIYADDARIVSIGAAGVSEVPRSRLAFFFGSTVERDGVRAVISVDPERGTVWGLSASADGWHEIVPPDATRSHHVITRSGAFRPPGAPEPSWACGQESLPLGALELSPPRAPSLPREALASPPTLVAVVAVDTDNELMQLKFSDNTTTATSYIAQLIAGMTLIYERDALVRLVQGYTVLRLSSVADPYTQTGGSANGSQLNEFSSYWSGHYGGIRRSVAMLLSGKSSSDYSASGIAWLGSLCSTGYGYSFSEVFRSNYLAGDISVVAHEIGHNFGSPHTHCYSPPVDQCFSGEGSGCFSGTASCPTASDITTRSGTVVSNVRGTLMSYCHLLSGCAASTVFHPRSLTDYLDARIATATNSCLFATGSAAPTITSLGTVSGPPGGGTTVVINGSNFRSPATVAFADLGGAVAAASVTFNSDSRLTVTTPAHAAGTVDVVVMNPDLQTATATSAFTFVGAATLVPITPCRVLDTRSGSGPTGGAPLAAGARNVFVVSGTCGVPGSARAVVANLTVVGAAAEGDLRVVGGHLASTATSALSIPVSRARANNAIVQLSTGNDGTIAVTNASAGTVHFILDVSGYFQ
jgi:hypothetical protein